MLLFCLVFFLNRDFTSCRGVNTFFSPRPVIKPVRCPVLQPAATVLCKQIHCEKSAVAVAAAGQNKESKVRSVRGKKPSAARRVRKAGRSS